MNIKIVTLLLIVLNSFNAITQTKTIPQLIVTAPNGLSVRNKPSLQGNKIGKLLYEDIVQVIEKTAKKINIKDGKNIISGNWIKIQIPETNKQGYAFGGFLNELNDKLPNMNSPLKYRLSHLIIHKFPVKDSITYKDIENRYILNEKEWQTLGFNTLEKFNKSFIFSIYNVLETEHGFILFVERDYEHESYHWLCLVNYDLILKDEIAIAYDNAEGFTGTETSFNGKNITVDYYNIYENPKNTSTTYNVEDLAFKKLP